MAGGLKSFTSLCARRAKHRPATGAESFEISQHAGFDCTLVRNVIAAQPLGFILARGPLLRRSLRGDERRRKHGH